MKHYIELKISSYTELSDIIKTAHKSGIKFAFYFDNINKARVFSDSVELLSQFNTEILETPTSVKYIKCMRVQRAELTPTLETKRTQRLRQHIETKGVVFDESKVAIKPHDYDYYINMHSISTNRNYRLYIKNKVVFKQGSSDFSSYGLSLNSSAVPLF